MQVSNWPVHGRPLPQAQPPLAGSQRSLRPNSQAWQALPPLPGAARLQVGNAVDTHMRPVQHLVAVVQLRHWAATLQTPFPAGMLTQLEVPVAIAHASQL